MSSKEVRDAVGAAPAKAVKNKSGNGTTTKAEKGTTISAAQLLREKRQALALARERYATAKQSYDERAMADETRLIAGLTVILSELEQVAGAEVEANGRKEAEARTLGISRVVGSVVASTVEDRERVLEAARAYAEAVDRLNERFLQYQGLVAEDAALRDRFGIAGAKIPRVVSPNETPSVIAAADTTRVAYETDRVIRPQTEKDEHGLRERRTYGEIRGTAAYTIIESVGPKPWRPLTEREQQAITALGTEKETNSQFLGELEVEATIARALGTLGVPGGEVQRG